MKVMFLRKLEDATETRMKMHCRTSCIKVEKDTDNNDSVSWKQSKDEDDDGEGIEADDLDEDAQKRKKQATDEQGYEESCDDEKNEPSSLVE